MNAIDLPKIVSVAHAQGYCAASTVSIDDSFPTDTTVEDVVGIAKIKDGDDVVGWIYRTKSGRFFLQGNNRMSTHDQATSKIHIMHPARNLRTVSPIVPFDAIGRDLSISDCTPSEYTLTPAQKP